MTEFGEVTVPGVFIMVPGGADGSVLVSRKRTNINKSGIVWLAMEPKVSRNGASMKSGHIRLKWSSNALDNVQLGSNESAIQGATPQLVWLTFGGANCDVRRD